MTGFGPQIYPLQHSIPGWRLKDDKPVRVESLRHKPVAVVASLRHHLGLTQFAAFAKNARSALLGRHLSAAREMTPTQAIRRDRLLLSSGLCSADFRRQRKEDP